MLRAAELRDDERAECQKERAGNIACQIAATRRERYDPHKIAYEDEEEARQQIRRILLVTLTHTRLDDIVFNP